MDHYSSQLKKGRDDAIDEPCSKVAKGLFDQGRDRRQIKTESWLVSLKDGLTKISPHPLISPIPDVYEYDLAEDEVKLEVPGYRQMDGFSCGPVAGWSILQTFHPGTLSFREFYLDCQADEDGCSEDQVVEALRMNDIGISIRPTMTFKDMVRTIDKGFPILTGISPRGYADHWVGIYGYGLEPKRLFTCNHTNMAALHGREIIGWKDWTKLWDKTSNYLICWGK
jgi:hypothetical protein